MFLCEEYHIHWLKVNAGASAICYTTRGGFERFLAMMVDGFQCRRCGACCRVKDGIVRVSDAEISRIAAFLGVGESEFVEHSTELAPDRKSLVLKSRTDGSCVYLTEDNLCSINSVKPDKCGSFPFAWTNPDSDSVCPALRALHTDF